MSDQLNIYPSGFLGSSTVEKPQVAAIVSNAHDFFNRGITKAESRFPASKEVMDLWTITLSGSPEYRTFEFKERILKYAFDAFGTDKLLDWIVTQGQSPHFTDMHARWLEETLRYVLTNKPRAMSGTSWKAILSTDSLVTIRDALTPGIKGLLFEDTGTARQSSGLCRKDMSLKEFIGLWVQRPDGIGDLMGSLYMLFGKQ